MPKVLHTMDAEALDRWEAQARAGTLFKRPPYAAGSKRTDPRAVRARDLTTPRASDEGTLEQARALLNDDRGREIPMRSRRGA